MDGRITLAAVVIALVSWFTIVLLAWPTYEGMSPATGNVAACADAVLHGEAPGQAQGQLFSGTLYFPPVPLMVATFKSTGMSWRASLRWVNFFSMLGLLAA